MLKRIAEILDTDVTHLLGSPIEPDTNIDMVAEQLSRINEQLIIKNRRSRRIWKTIGTVFLIIFLVQLFLVIIGMVAFDNLKISSNYTEAYVEEIIEE